MAPVMRDRHFTAHRVAGLVKDVTQVAASVKLRDAEILDARSPSRFAGTEAEARPGLRSGHMPGAKNVHYRTLLNDDMTMKSEEGLAHHPLMLTQNQIDEFHSKGYLVVPDVVNDALPGVRAEYTALLDTIWQDWVAEGRVKDTPEFEDRIIAAYRAGCEYFQPMDISLPTGEIPADTPMHTGPAIFNMMRHARLLDLVEDLIGPEITSNPIQHVRIKPPATDMRDGENRGHITKTEWHQDRGVTQELARLASLTNLLMKPR